MLSLFVYLWYVFVYMSPCPILIESVYVFFSFRPIEIVEIFFGIYLLNMYTVPDA